MINSLKSIGLNLTIIIFILSAFSFTSNCQNTVKLSQLTEKDGVMFLADSPYTGRCTENFKDGKPGLEGNFKSGKKDGEWIWYYETGTKKRTTTYKDGVKSGKATYWYKNGVKKSEIIYDNDKNIRQNSWDENGKPMKNPGFEKFT